jgi:hypothetical protein
VAQAALQVVNLEYLGIHTPTKTTIQAAIACSKINLSQKREIDCKKSRLRSLGYRKPKKSHPNSYLTLHLHMP